MSKMSDNTDDQKVTDEIDTDWDADLPEGHDWAQMPPSPALVTDLLDHQLTMTVGGSFGAHLGSALRQGALKLYSELGPADVIDSILARQAVVLNNVSMECFERFTMSTKSNWRLGRLGLKASELTVSTLRIFEERKKKRQDLT
jgi:hypothetical protein